MTPSVSFSHTCLSFYLSNPGFSSYLSLSLSRSLSPTLVSLFFFHSPIPVSLFFSICGSLSAALSFSLSLSLSFSLSLSLPHLSLFLPFLSLQFLSLSLPHLSCSLLSLSLSLSPAPIFLSISLEPRSLSLSFSHSWSPPICLSPAMLFFLSFSLAVYLPLFFFF